MSFGFFGHEAWGILTAWPGVKPTLPALEGEVLTTGLPGNHPKQTPIKELTNVDKNKVLYIFNILWYIFNILW